MSEGRLDPAGAGSWLVSGELSFETVPGLLERGRPAFEGGAGMLRFDLRNVTRSDSAGLALLIEWLKAARGKGRVIEFMNVPPQMIAIAKVSGLEAVLPFGHGDHEAEEGPGAAERKE